MWRTLIGLHDSVEYSLMEAGHTQFNPDWHFGLWKVKWRHTSVETLQEMAYQLLVHGLWFSPAFSTTKTGCHDIVEILLKVALKH
jgi:hypothetical protein